MTRKQYLYNDEVVGDSYDDYTAFNTCLSEDIRVHV